MNICLFLSLNKLLFSKFPKDLLIFIWKITLNIWTRVNMVSHKEGHAVQHSVSWFFT